MRVTISPEWGESPCTPPDVYASNWRSLAVTIRSHRVDSAAATPVASETEIGGEIVESNAMPEDTIRFQGGPRPSLVNSPIWLASRESHPDL